MELSSKHWPNKWKSLQQYNFFFYFIFKGTLLHCWWECKLVQPLWRTVWRFLKKLETELPYDPAIPLLGIHTEETRRERDTCTPMFIAPIQFLINLLTAQRNLYLDSLEHLMPLTVGRLWAITCGRKNLFRQARGLPKEFVGWNTVTPRNY